MNDSTNQTKWIKELWFIWVFLSVVIPLGFISIHDYMEKRINTEDGLIKIIDDTDCSKLDKGILGDWYNEQKGMILKDTQRVFDHLKQRLDWCSKQ